jgi:hypothetical protein
MSKLLREIDSLSAENVLDSLSAENALVQFLKIRHATQIGTLDRQSFRNAADTKFYDGQASATQLSNPSHWIHCFSGPLTKLTLTRETDCPDHGFERKELKFPSIYVKFENDLQESFTKYEESFSSRFGCDVSDLIGNELDGCGKILTSVDIIPANLPAVLIVEFDVDPPLDVGSINLFGQMYSLSAVTRGLPGHFISYLKYDKKWYLYDDTDNMVTLVKALNSSTYIDEESSNYWFFSKIT